MRVERRWDSGSRGMRGLRSWDMKQFSVHPELTSSYMFVRRPKNEKEMVFVERVSFFRLVVFYGIPA